MMILWLLLLTVLALNSWLRHKYSYFKGKGIPHLPAPSWSPMGHLGQLLFLRISFGDLFKNIYADPRCSQAKVMGFYVLQTPALMIRDPELIRLLLIKNFNSFLNRYEAADHGGDPMGALTLPLAKYHNWKESRQCMSQLFTSGRLREVMYPQMTSVVHDLENYLKRKLRDLPDRVLSLSRMCQLYTTDVTGNLFYSLDVGGLRQGRSQLLKKTKELFRTNPRKVLDFMSVFFLPKWTNLVGARVFSEDYAQFMRDLVKEHEEPKEADLINQLQRFQLSRSSDHYSQHPDFVASQAGIILLAGFETSSALMGFTLYELAKAPETQERLRQELSDAFRASHTSSLDYDTLAALPYLKMVCLEALRLYPAAAFINRECTSPEAEGFSLQPHVDYVIPPGMPAYISILGLQRDEKVGSGALTSDESIVTP